MGDMLGAWTFDSRLDTRDGVEVEIWPGGPSRGRGQDPKGRLLGQPLPPATFFGEPLFLMGMYSLSAPVAVLAIKAERNSADASDLSEPVYGGYANGRGNIVLFGKEAAYGVNLKKQTLQLRPQLNPGAQARYDAAAAGEDFQYGNKTFRRLSEPQIIEICVSSSFRLTPRQLPY